MLNKSISSNFTVNSNHAHSSFEYPISEGVFANDSHYNSGRLENGFAGFIKTENNKFAYHNVDIRAHLEVLKKTPYY